MSSRPIRSCFLFAVAIFLAFAPLAWAFANPDPDDIQSNNEYQTKAAYLFKIALFVEWPSRKFTQSDSPLVIGVVGTDPFGESLVDAVGARRINDRTVVVKHIDTPEEMRKCHILFVSRSEAGRLNAIFSEIHSDNVLTVGDSDDKFISRGGMINLVYTGNTVKLQINNPAAKRANIKISSSLYPMLAR